MLSKTWNYITNIGVQNGYDSALTKRIILSNQFNTVAIVIYFLSGINNYLLGDVFSAILLISFVFISLIGFYLQKIKWHTVGITFTFVAINLAIFYFESYSGFLSGTYLFHFPLVLAITFIYDFKLDKKLMVFHFVLIVGLLFTNTLTDYSLFKNDFITDDNRHTMFLFNIMASFLGLSFFVYLTIQNNLNERRLFLENIAEREQSEKIITQALAEKNTLIAELHHRVKNNLAIISSLFNLKLNDDLHIDAKNVLIESRNRVRSMALIHNRLYNGNELTSVNFEEYATELVSEINTSYPAIANTVKVNAHFKQSELNVAVAIPCGLILNELLTNCYKHAFTNQANGIIDISFTETNSECTLSVKDNGGGLPINYSKKQSLGITVIEALSEQLEGTFSFTNNNGTCFELKFKY